MDEADFLTDSGTVRQRKLPFESMVWLLVGITIYNNKSMKDLVNQFDIVDCVGRALLRQPSALI